jgi:excisionase family DNA binding protein
LEAVPDDSGLGCGGRKAAVTFCTDFSLVWAALRGCHWGSALGEVRMPQSIERSSEAAFSLTDAAARLGWSRRTLTRALERHGIPTIGTGRRARLEPKDLETLKAKERTKSAARMSVEPTVEPRRVIEPMPVGAGINARERSYWRRYLGQINRRSPIEKATSPLKLILYFTDLDETARQMDMLQRALEEARPITNDESLDEEQKRVNLRKTLKAATSAIWASHHSGGKRQHGHGNRQ